MLLQVDMAFHVQCQAAHIHAACSRAAAEQSTGPVTECAAAARLALTAGCSAGPDLIWSRSMYTVHCMRHAPPLLPRTDCRPTSSTCPSPHRASLAAAATAPVQLRVLPLGPTAPRVQSDIYRTFTFGRTMTLVSRCTGSEPHAAPGGYSLQATVHCAIRPVVECIQGDSESPMQCSRCTE